MDEQTLKAWPPSRRWLRCVGLIACVLLMASCRSSEEPPSYSMGFSRVFYVVNPTYHRRMNALFHRARQVPTDSLSRLYAALLRAPGGGSRELRESVGCELERLQLVYGGAAFDMALERVNDSLAQAHLGPQRLNALIAGPPGDRTEFGSQGCFAANAKLPDPPDSLELQPIPWEW